jgi:hypothetical protein
MTLPNARLVSIKNVAHAPWTEARIVFGAISSFLADAWPDTASKVHTRDPNSSVSL